MRFQRPWWSYRPQCNFHWRSGVVYMDQEDASHFRAMRLHRRRSDRDYVSVTIGGKNYYVYRLIMQARPSEDVHHRDGNPLNCCRSNLVLLPRAENAAIRRKPTTGMSSRYLGVSRSNSGAKYHVRIRVRGTLYDGGWYSDEIAAALAYDELAIRLRGPMALVNFPERATVKQSRPRAALRKSAPSSAD